MWVNAKYELPITIHLEYIRLLDQFHLVFYYK